jgi:hypothetical protein
LTEEYLQAPLADLVMEKQNFNLKSYLAATKPIFEIIPES